MSSNHIEYSIPCSFLFDKPIEFNIGNLRVILISSLKILLVKFECYEEVDESEFVDQVAVELEKLLDKITFTYSVKFGDPIIILKSIANKVEFSNRAIGKFSIVSPP